MILERSEAALLKPGQFVLYDQAVRQGGFDWRTHEASVTKVGARRIKIAFDGREAWVSHERLRLPVSN